MTTTVEKTIEVDAPLHSVYNQWTQFEQFPEFMGGVEQVRQLNETMLHWVAQIAGVKREWDAAIVEQVPDQKVAWAATAGTTNAGEVSFEPRGTDRTAVRLVLEYEPQGAAEKVADWFNVVSRQAQSDLEKFKEFIESRGADTGAWRGAVGQGRVGAEGVGSAPPQTATGGGVAYLPEDPVAANNTNDTAVTSDPARSPSGSPTDLTNEETHAPERETR